MTRQIYHRTNRPGSSQRDLSLFVCQYLSVPVSLCLSLSVSVCLCQYPSVSVSLCLSLSVSVCLYQSVSASGSLCLILFVFFSLWLVSECGSRLLINVNYKRDLWDVLNFRSTSYRNLQLLPIDYGGQMPTTLCQHTFLNYTEQPFQHRRRHGFALVRGAKYP